MKRKNIKKERPKTEASFANNEASENKKTTEKTPAPREEQAP